MKPVYPLLIACMLLVSLKASAQRYDVAVMNKSVREIILEVPRLEAVKTLSVFRKNIKGIQHVSFEGFCESRRLLFLKADDAAYAEIETVLQSMNMPYYLKRGVSHERAKQSCDSRSEIENSLILQD